MRNLKAVLSGIAVGIAMAIMLLAIMLLNLAVSSPIW